MSFSTFTSSFYLLTFTLLFQTVFGTNPLFHICSNNDNFTATSPYATSLNKLQIFLEYQTPVTGFALGSLGINQDRPYALALCRGDVSSSDCKTCAANASSEIRKRCQGNKGAIIWYDNCLVKYSSNEFFGQLDNQNKFYMWNQQNVTDPMRFSEKTKELLSKLSQEACLTTKMYAAGDLEIGGSKKLYGLAQCTRDLSSADCKNCLDGIIGELPSCCDGKEGGRVVSGSCNVGYEIYPFINA